MSACLANKSFLLEEITFSHCYNATSSDDFKKDFLLFNLKLLFELLKTFLELIWDNISNIILATALYYILKILYRAYWNPIIYKKELTEIGFEHIPSGLDRASNIVRFQAAKRMWYKTPPPYPNGWFAIAESRELKVGEVVAVGALGQNFAVYRGEDGEVRCVDAYCPHLGAHLAVGGAVSGNCIECPFHKWRFDENGVCVHVPGIEKPPKGVSIKKWLTVEADGAVWVWYDAKSRDPLWDMQDSPQIKKWGYRGRNEFYVNAHIQEIPENGADLAHLNAVHSTSSISALGEKYPFLYNLIGYHDWAANWTKGDDYTAVMNLTHDYRILKYNLGHVDVHITQIGPAYVRLLLQSAIGPVLIIQSVTPLGPLLQKVVHRMYSPTYNALFGAFLVKYEGDMFERDIRIWNSKKFVNTPTYVKTDKTIRAFRAWYSQFYSENSIRFSDANQQNPWDW